MENTNQNLENQFMETPPENYMVWAILSTVFCCMPLGIVSIVKASEVNTKWNAGDYEGARQSSAGAKKFALYALYSGIAVAVIYFVFFIGLSILGILSEGAN